MKKYILSILILIALVGFFAPVAVVHAAGSCNIVGTTTRADCESLPGGFWTETNTCNFSTIPNPKFQDLLGYATCIISGSVIPLIFALALVMFIWGVVQYVINSDEEAKKEKGKQFMLWGIIALTVMVSVWGLVKILGNTFGIEYVIPQVKSQVR